MKGNKSKSGRGDPLHTFTSLQGPCTPLAVRSDCWSSSMKGKHSVYPRTYPLTWKFMVKVNTVNLFCHCISQVLFLGLCPSKPSISELSFLDNKNRQFSTPVTLSIAIVICIDERQLSRSSWTPKESLPRACHSPTDRPSSFWANTWEIFGGHSGRRQRECALQKLLSKY